MLAPVSRAARFRDQLQSTATKRTQSSPTEVTWARAVRRSPPSEICHFPASARSSCLTAAWSLELWVLRRHPPYVPPYPYSPRALCMGGTPDAAADDLRIISYRASPGASVRPVRTWCELDTSFCSNGSLRVLTIAQSLPCVSRVFLIEKT
jgi:hypothetical protein